MEDGALAYFDQIDRMGGMVAAIEQGFPQREIAESSYRFQQAVERRDKIIVGVNDFIQGQETPIDTLYIDETATTRQLERLARVKATRDTAKTQRTLAALRAAASTTTNLMPPLLEAVRAYATLGEICDTLRDVWGEYEETPVI